MDINELVKEIHQNAVEKGFWEDPSNMDDKLALVISELSEGLEAHRSGRFANLEYFNLFMSADDSDFYFIDEFKDKIKDTFEDELADTIIRILDLCGYIKVDVDIFLLEGKPLNGLNFGVLFMTFIDRINNVYVLYGEAPKSAKLFVLKLKIEDCLSLLFQYCKDNNIDIDKHIELKMKYNATRPRKHGKLY